MQEPPTEAFHQVDRRRSAASPDRPFAARAKSIGRRIHNLRTNRTCAGAASASAERSRTSSVAHFSMQHIHRSSRSSGPIQTISHQPFAAVCLNNRHAGRTRPSPNLRECGLWHSAVAAHIPWAKGSNLRQRRSGIGPGRKRMLILQATWPLKGDALFFVRSASPSHYLPIKTE